MLKVCQRPELIQQLNHGLDFVADKIVNDMILTKYSLWDYLTPCDADNINILNSCINRYREEANQLYKTTLFEYNPIENYNMVEKGKDKRTPDLKTEYEAGTNSTRSETGYNLPRQLVDAEKVTNGGKDTTTETGTDTNEHELTRSGNIGVTTTQQMIQAERDIVLDVVSWYVGKFERCFTVSLSVGDYECLSPCESDIIDTFTCGTGDDDSTIKRKLDTIDNAIGNLGNELTTCCTNMSGEIDALKKSVADSKVLLAGAISDKGVDTASNDTFATMADNIGQIQTGVDRIYIYNTALNIINAKYKSFIEVTI